MILFLIGYYCFNIILIFNGRCAFSRTCRVFHCKSNLKRARALRVRALIINDIEIASNYADNQPFRLFSQFSVRMLLPHNVQWTFSNVVRGCPRNVMRFIVLRIPYCISFGYRCTY